MQTLYEDMDEKLAILFVKDDTVNMGYNIIHTIYMGYITYH